MKKTTSLTFPIAASCPACGLLCDDVILTSAAPVDLKNACAKGITFFEQSFQTGANESPSIAGKPCDLTTAIRKAADILSKSKSALFAGLGTEVQGMRAIMRLAEETNATLDHMHSDSTVRNTLTMQNGGWLTTTLAEVKNRADVILAIGTDIATSHPRFFEKTVWNTESLFNKPTPEVIYLGVPAEKTQASISPNGTKPTVIAADLDKIPEIVNALNALLVNKKLKAETVGSVPVTTLLALVDKLKAAQYLVAVWSASSFKFTHAELTIQSIVQLINQLNETSRAAGLPLNSGDGDSSVNNTSTWLSGYPTRSRYVDGKPEYDTYHFSISQQLKSCDALLWVSTFNPHPPPESEAPTIVIGHPGMRFKYEPDVFIPVGIPGVDHTGLMFRLDSSITLPLKKLRDSQLPKLSDVINHIEAALLSTDKVSLD
ncbi:MAG: formylmethanofuran dehydrogenase [Betaproteobacteria bacterium HGW-Betaproteobacteria-22]|nr:MAG: formylmethanofuran dehydrogenase [Betaproteobacteria bacterium HGW-Betaproteobacteria-22]